MSLAQDQLLFVIEGMRGGYSVAEDVGDVAFDNVELTAGACTEG